jgi:glycosyltransferase involved in cell wall biosynthesis
MSVSVRRAHRSGRTLRLVDRPITVLLVINRLTHGGAERSLAELLPHYAKAGVRPIVACLAQARDGLEDEVIADGFDVRIVRGREFANRSRDVRGLASAVRDLRSIVRREDPDLVHTTLFAADIAGRLAAARTPAATLTSVVGNTYIPERLADPHVTALKLRVSRAVDSWTGRAVNDHFHAVSNATKVSAQAAFKIPDNRITVIYRGRDGTRLGRPSPERRAAARQALDVPPDTELIVNVGKQEFRKGQATLLDALALLAPQRPRLLLLQAGYAGQCTDDLRARASRAELRDHVRFLGHRTDVPELLAAADLFVFPSLDEGLGGSAIEAMALGLPIVASDIPAMREIHDPGRNALLVPPSNPQKLADAIAQLLDDPAMRTAFGLRSRQIFDERFTLEQSAERMLSLYTEVIEQHRARRGRSER